MGDLYASAIGTVVFQIKEIPARPADFDGALCIFDLVEGTTEEELVAALERFGPIDRCQLDCDPAAVYFTTHEAAICAAAAVGSKEACAAFGLPCAGTCVLYNERSYDGRTPEDDADRQADEGRGWCCFETAVSHELLARLTTYPRMKAALDKLPPKMISIGSNKFPEVVDLDSKLQVQVHMQASLARIQRAAFTGSGDKDKVPALYVDYVEKIVGALQSTLAMATTAMTIDRALSIKHLDMPSVLLPSEASPLCYANQQHILLASSAHRLAGGGMATDAQLSFGVTDATGQHLDHPMQAGTKTSDVTFDACHQDVLPWRSPDDAWVAQLLVDVEALRLGGNAVQNAREQLMATARAGTPPQASIDGAVTALEAARALPNIGPAANTATNALRRAARAVENQAGLILEAAAMMNVDSLIVSTLRNAGASGVRQYGVGQWLSVQLDEGVWTDVMVGDNGMLDVMGAPDELHPWNHAPRQLPQTSFEKVRDWHEEVLRSEHALIDDAISGTSMDSLTECVPINMTGSDAAGNPVKVECSATLSAWLSERYTALCAGQATEKPTCALTVAGPAAGKSWLMSQVIMHTLTRRATSKSAYNLIPILIKVDQLQKALLENEDAFSHSWNWVDAYLQLECELPHYRMLRQAMMARRALLLLDGLDEAGMLRERMERHVTEVLAPQGHVLLCTSRPTGLNGGRFRAFHRFSLSPLSESQQDDFIAQRLGEERAGKLRSYLQQVPIDLETSLRVTANPLMLSMVLSIADLRQGISMPKTIAALYEVAVGAMLLRAHVKISDDVLALLQATFFQAHLAGTRIITLEHVEAAATSMNLHSKVVELCGLIKKGSLPLVRLMEAEPIEFQSFHLSFQEFFAMRGICTGATMPSFSWSPWWTNVVRMGVEEGGAFGTKFVGAAKLPQVVDPRLSADTPLPAGEMWRLDVAAAIVREGLPASWLSVLVDLGLGLSRLQSNEDRAFADAIGRLITNEITFDDPFAVGESVHVHCNVDDCTACLPGEIVASSKDTLDCKIKGEQRIETGVRRSSVFKIDSDSGAGALMRAASTLGAAFLVEAIMSCGVSIYLSDREHWTPLHLAARHGHESICKLLVQAGADPFSSDGITPSPSELALVNCHGKCLHVFRPSPTDEDFTNDKLPSELLEAAQRGISCHVKAILATGGHDVNETCGKQVCALHLASRYNHPMTVMALLAGGANLEAKTASGITPLMLAVEENCGEVVQTLCRWKANVSAVDEHQRTPLSLAAATGSTAVLEILINSGAGMNGGLNHFNKLGQTVLTVACSFGHAGAVDLLLKHKADPAVFHPDSRASSRGTDTALLAACRANSMETVARLLAAGVDPNHRPPITEQMANLDPWSPLIEAACHGRDAIVAQLLASKADPNLNLKGNAGPLYFSACNGHLETTRMLVEAGAEVDAADRSNGRNGLWWAATEGHAVICGYLVDVGANVNHHLHERAERAGTTPLYQAAARARHETITMLLQKRADINVKEWKSGQTALHIAACDNHDESVRRLLAFKPDCSICNFEGKTASDLATAAGHTRVATMINEHALGPRRRWGTVKLGSVLKYGMKKRAGVAGVAEPAGIGDVPLNSSVTV